MSLVCKGEKLQMKSKEDILAEYKKVKRNVVTYHTAKGIPLDTYGNQINGYDNIFNEGMLKALEFVLSVE